ncbi:acetyl/propionyl-CoA carboxylase alpha subunit [Caulobacter ginsengisoli]|uniref:Acetyl/propionyl-CoA carboxylase alpha subunit n=1 Tax=Caulobacter ginsengisoli TaxID=400775 RepID=A0ABU0IW81_9CAUL|nr:carboxyl transferase domain-containing protein [Caulobacter ginsengisoli]MDQ0465182.1 acetyl/propionyl-CoA carboxylase alpha subunit [Caulobacter ginsengisoli]
MPFKRVLIANRGEIAIRIARAAADLGMSSLAVYAEDDADSRHVRAADAAVALEGTGARAYLDIDAMIDAAKAGGCDAVHPGYGFLSENAAFARACAAAGLTFVGPSPEALETFGDKAAARALAAKCGVPLLAGTGALDLAGAKTFFAKTGPMMLKAIAGGGGRGMRAVRTAAEVEPAFAACQREAEAAFGDGAVYAEWLVEQARHIEVQVAGDGEAVIAVGERDCSIQRRHQKLIEIAPAFGLTSRQRLSLHAAAVKLCEAAGYRTLATVEFLVDASPKARGDGFAFIETNARLQVEHTVTEEVTGIDLVRAQFLLAGGASLEEAGLTETPEPRGYAIQARVNLETLQADGSTAPSGGLIGAYEPPAGPGVRVDGYGYAGYLTSPNYDSLLAKVIVRGPTLADAAARTARALGEFRVEGVETNAPLLRAILARPEVADGRATTRFLEDHLGEVLADAALLQPRGWAGSATATAAPVFETLDGAEPVTAPLQATVGAIEAAEGDLVHAGQIIAILEAMKMEHVVVAPMGGRVVRIAAAKGETLLKGAPILFLESADVAGVGEAAAVAQDLDFIRPDLAEVIERHGFTLDENRPDSVARRRKTGHRTARENIDDLLDADSFIEYGALTIAAQRRRRTLDDLIRSTPADGLIAGIGTVNAADFGPEKARVAALSYDFTVLAGTQGHMNHKKTDRLLHIVEEQKLPVVWYAEGGGGRPGDTDGTGVAGLDVTTFGKFAELSGEVPKIAIVAGRCFAGNAAIAGLSEIIIATRDSNLGMGGPAMIEGGGLGVFKPDDIGPSHIQWANGVIDVLADDEAHATALAKQALGYFQGHLTEWSCVDQRTLRAVVPENRLRVYEVRNAIEAIADAGTFLELRRGFAAGMITGFVRIEGRPMGLMANDPRHLGGAIDCDGAEKAARFLQLCDAFDLPVLSLCDTPGFMVGPESEAAAAVRKVSRQFIAGAKLGTPLFCIVLRKGYGLGAQAMAGGGFHSPVFIAAWPTGEFGGMGLEGAIKLGYRKELEAETDPVKQKALYDSLVARLYAAGKATSMASALEIDAVIDPAETRRWIMRGLQSCPPRKRPARRWVDSW